ncbi:MAG: DUF427 domain-containing protein [Anderseniella sp.]
MTNPQVTLATSTIHNPDEPRHFMRIKPVRSRVRIRLDDTLVAESRNAIRLLEVGRDFYDPMVYVPGKDIMVELDPVSERTSHCPLKGEAVYFTYTGWIQRDPDDYLAWAYPEPFGFAQDLAGLVAFNPVHVTIEEAPG